MCVELRAQLQAAMHQSHGGPHGYGDLQSGGGQNAHDHIIDPAIGGPGMMGSGDDGDDMGDGRKGAKRELSQSKRAAQNRAAQVRFPVMVDVMSCPLGKS